MRVLVDECTGPAVASWLKAQGHDVLSAFDEARGASDDGLLERARAEGRILVTNDRDFGVKVFRDRQSPRGVIFLRLKDSFASRTSEPPSKSPSLQSCSCSSTSD
jgi:predicted nuclease of predicted toxin-antitoxin system